jgi:fido (protein-threonine AMPylation protein)
VSRTARTGDREARAKREAGLTANRISELYEDPIEGEFDADHLKAIHAYIFQDLPEHQPGIIRERTEQAWIKHRALEGRAVAYDVHYANQRIEERVEEAFKEFCGPRSVMSLGRDLVAVRIAKLYGDLDYAHPFYEGNSRTLREFTRELAGAAGFELDWIGTTITERERNQLYMARDLAVMERAFPGLTPERAMKTNDRAEYEASFVLEGLRKAVGDKRLEAIIGDRLLPR